MKKTVALALGSGGARGYAHIGFIKALKEYDYEIVKISGSSMGAIVGSLYCAGKLDEFESWVCSLKQLDMIKLLDISPLSSGVIRGDKIFNEVDKILGDLNIEELPISFTAVATDLIRRREVWFQKGSVIQAVRASSAIPSIFSPVIMGKRYLVDGGVINPVPIIPCSSANAEHIFAVDLNGETGLPEAEQPENIQEQQEDIKESEQEEPQAKNTKQDNANTRFAWFNQVTNKATNWLEDKHIINSTDASSKEAEEGISQLGKLETLSQIMEVMQASITQYKTAGYPPDMLVKMPASACQSYEFYRAKGIIEMGYQIAKDAIESYEKGNSSTYGQLW